MDHPKFSIFALQALGFVCSRKSKKNHFLAARYRPLRLFSFLPT